MARRTNTRIQKPHLILCEGADAENFLIAWLNNPLLSHHPIFSNDIQVMDFGGIADLPRFLKVIQSMEGYSTAASILVMRDAERDAEAAIREVCAALKRAKLPVPAKPRQWEDGRGPKTGFLLFPSCNDSPRNGTLEDLCLDILSDESRAELLEEIQRFMDLLHKKNHREFPHAFKTKLHTYFSITDAFVSMKIGEAARAGAFNWGHEKLRPMQDFLLELVPAQ